MKRLRYPDATVTRHAVRRLTVAVVLTVLVTVPRSVPAQEPDRWPPLIARATDLVSRLVSGDIEPVRQSFNEKMKAAASPAMLRQLMPGLAVQTGAFLRIAGTRTVSSNGLNVVIVTCDMERAQVGIRVVFDAAGQIAGLFLTPPAPTAPYTSPPYVTANAFRDETLTVDAGGWPLPATLSMPLGDGPFPGLVLVHGSGPADRDETVGANKPFRDLAEGLASRGIAVLRYDKRTRVHAGRMAGLTNLTVKEEVVDDAVAAVRALRERPGIRPDRVFVAGHSLGGMMAPRIAAADPAIAGLVLLAASATRIEDAIVAQVRHLAGLDGKISPEEQANIDAMEKAATELRKLESTDPLPTGSILNAPVSYWMDMRAYDPTGDASRLTIPMLVLQGERDYQVTLDDLARWKKALGARQNVQFRTYPALNHLFIAGSGPLSPAEYSEPGHVDGAVVVDIASWILRQ
jgi:dienelactone hydrolase